MKRESSRAVIIDNNRVLTMFRRKIDEAGNKNEYYAIPGGGIEENETMEKAVVRELQEELKEQNLTDTQVERYKKLLEDQYRNLTYEIKNEKIDGDHAIVTVQIEVIDYKKSISDLTYDSTKYTKESYDDAKLDLLEKAKDKVTYTLELGVTKDKNNNWRLDSLSNADIKKIQGMY